MRKCEQEDCITCTIRGIKFIVLVLKITKDQLEEGKVTNTSVVESERNTSYWQCVPYQVRRWLWKLINGDKFEVNRPKCTKEDAAFDIQMNGKAYRQQTYFNSSHFSLLKTAETSNTWKLLDRAVMTKHTLSTLFPSRAHNLQKKKMWELNSGKPIKACR